MTKRPAANQSARRCGRARTKSQGKYQELDLEGKFAVVHKDVYNKELGK